MLQTFKIIFYVPVNHADTVKKALFEVGAGKIGNYDCCSWQVLGQGQFRPLSGSQPFIGNKNQIEIVEEYRVEIICEDCILKPALQALKAAHPYETPAYEVYQLIDV
jgi:hypothetical protein